MAATSGLGLQGVALVRAYGALQRLARLASGGTSEREEKRVFTMA
jgi:hypothetical protein